MKHLAHELRASGGRLVPEALGHLADHRID